VAIGLLTVPPIYYAAYHLVAWATGTSAPAAFALTGGISALMKEAGNGCEFIGKLELHETSASGFVARSTAGNGHQGIPRRR